MGEGQLEMGVGPVSTIHPVIIDEKKGGVLPPLALHSLYPRVQSTHCAESSNVCVCLYYRLNFETLTLTYLYLKVNIQSKIFCLSV